jgi:glycerol-3-phosphate dehydrogenase
MLEAQLGEVIEDLEAEKEVRKKAEEQKSHLNIIQYILNLLHNKEKTRSPFSSI